MVEAVTQPNQEMSLIEARTMGLHLHHQIEDNTEDVAEAEVSHQDLRVEKWLPIFRRPLKKSTNPGQF